MPVLRHRLRDRFDRHSDSASRHWQTHTGRAEMRRSLFQPLQWLRRGASALTGTARSRVRCSDPVQWSARIPARRPRNPSRTRSGCLHKSSARQRVHYRVPAPAVSPPWPLDKLPGAAAVRRPCPGNHKPIRATHRPRQTAHPARLPVADAPPPVRDYAVFAGTYDSGQAGRLRTPADYRSVTCLVRLPARMDIRYAVPSQSDRRLPPGCE